MAFPLPLDPDFRKEVIKSWIEDCNDRLDLGKVEDAKISWQIANSLYLNLPPGTGDLSIEDALMAIRVKLD